MPPKIKISKQQILDCSVDIVCADGFEKLNARELARRLGCSVQPIFREFNSMQGLKDSVYKAVQDIYNNQMLSSMSAGENGFAGMGIVYINFAISKPNFFKLLFMSNTFQSRNVSEIAGSTEGDDEVLDMLCKETGLSRKSAQELYTGVWITTHGMASLYATNNCNFNEEENKKILSNCFEGLLLILRQNDLNK